jgi:hypothetical protein
MTCGKVPWHRPGFSAGATGDFRRTSGGVGPGGARGSRGRSPSKDARPPRTLALQGRSPSKGHRAGRRRMVGHGSLWRAAGLSRRAPDGATYRRVAEMRGAGRGGTRGVSRVGCRPVCVVRRGLRAARGDARPPGTPCGAASNGGAWIALEGGWPQPPRTGRGDIPPGRGNAGRGAGRHTWGVSRGVSPSVRGASWVARGSRGRSPSKDARPPGTPCGAASHGGAWIALEGGWPQPPRTGRGDIPPGRGNAGRGAGVAVRHAA